MITWLSELLLIFWPFNFLSTIWVVVSELLSCIKKEKPWFCFFFSNFHSHSWLFKQDNWLFFGGKLGKFGVALPTNLEAGCVLCFYIRLFSCLSARCLKKWFGGSWRTNSPWPKDQWISFQWRSWSGIYAIRDDYDFFLPIVCSSSKGGWKVQHSSKSAA